MELFDFFVKEIHLSEDITKKLLTMSHFEDVGKGEILIREGSYSNRLYFCEKGLARLFYHKNDKEVTHEFFLENSMYLPIECILYKRPIPYSFETLEPSQLRYFDYLELEKEIDKHKELQQFSRYFLLSVLKNLSSRLYSLQFQSAQEKYQTMIEQHPNLLLRAPLGHIASYLGITQQTLSVIRSKK